MGNNYRSERLLLGLSLEQAAEGIGVRADVLHKWETGESEPFADDLRRMAELYGCSPDCLLGLAERK